jgi:phosphatidylglycerophosphate synthase
VTPRLSPAYPIKALAVYATIMLVVIVKRGDHPFRRFGPANQVTSIRALLVALIAGLIGESADPSLAWTAIAGAASATVLDGLDGWLARRTRMESGFGARFDMEMDALLIQALAILVWQFGKAGPWIVAAGLLRYAFVGAGWVLPWMRQPLPTTVRGKLICVVQIAGLGLALLPGIAPPASSTIAAISFAALCWSFFIDTLWLYRCSG